MRFFRLFPAFVSAGLVLAACGGSTPSGGATPSASVPSDLSIKSFTADFSYMANLKSLVSAGHGKVGVILPDTTSSTRYVDFDAPYLKKAFDTAWYGWLWQQNWNWVYSKKLQDWREMVAGRALFTEVWLSS